MNPDTPIADVLDRAWQPIETAPRCPYELGAGRGPLIYVMLPWGWDVGYWEIGSGFFRNTGDDGCDDEQPSHWMPLPHASKANEPVFAHKLICDTNAKAQEIDRWQK